MANVSCNMIPDNISSGEDISGSNYTVSSSYYKGGLVRGTPFLTSDVATTNTVTQTTTTTTANRGTTTTLTPTTTTTSFTGGSGTSGY